MGAVRYSVSISNKSLVDRFKLECKKRGRKQSWVIENAMRYYNEHPGSGGWARALGVSKVDDSVSVHASSARRLVRRKPRADAADRTI